MWNLEVSDPWFRALENCCGVPQLAIHHPEGDVFQHSLQVVNWALRESNDFDLILAAMLHDVGKAVDFKGHEKYGVRLLGDAISEKTAWLIENHMRFWYFVLGEMRKLSKVQYLANHKWLPQLVLLARWDKMGRNPNKKIGYDRVVLAERLWEKYLN